MEIKISFGDVKYTLEMDIQNLTFHQAQFISWLCADGISYEDYQIIQRYIKHADIISIIDVLSKYGGIPTYHNLITYLCYGDIDGSYANINTSCICSLNWNDVDKTRIVGVAHMMCDIKSVCNDIIPLLSDEELRSITAYHREFHINANEYEIDKAPTIQHGSLLDIEYDDCLKESFISYTIGDYIIGTPPNGIEGIWPDHYIKSYLGMDILQYLTIMDWIHNVVSPRYIMFLLSKHGDLLQDVKYIEQREQYIHSPYAYKNIRNLPHIILNLFGRYTGKYDFRPEKFNNMTDTTGNYHCIPVDKRDELRHYLRDHSQIKVKPAIISDFFIEDYVDSWYFMPGHFTTKFNRLVENPYRLITNTCIIDKLISDLSHFRSNAVTFEQLINDLCKYEPCIPFKNIPYHIKVYILASLGIEDNLSFACDTIFTFIINDIVKGGKPGYDVTCSNPINLQYIEYIELNYHPAIYTYFNIPEFVTFDDIKIILSRGYIHPLPNGYSDDTSYDLYIRYEKLCSTKKIIFDRILDTGNTYIAIEKKMICSCHRSVGIRHRWNPKCWTAKVMRNKYKVFDTIQHDYPQFVESIEQWEPNDMSSTQGLIDTLDIIIPYGYDKVTYLIDNLHIYIDILNTLKLGVQCMSDKQIYHALGIYTPHTSRKSLIELYESKLYTQPYIHIQDIKHIIIGNSIYTLKDIIHKLKSGHVFPGLHDLCLNLKYGALIKIDASYSKQFDMILKLTQKFQPEQLKYTFDTFDVKDKGIIMKCLSNIFYMGIKFRYKGDRYKGNQHKSNSMFHSYDYDIQTLDIRFELNDTLNLLSPQALHFVSHLPCVIYNPKFTHDIQESLGSLWDNITGKAGLQIFEHQRYQGLNPDFDSIVKLKCIQSESRKLIATGHYYSVTFRDIYLERDNGFIPACHA